MLPAALAPRVRPRSRLRFHFESVEMLLMRRSSRHRRNLAHSAAVFRSRARCRIAKPVYAPVSMTDLNVSVTASIGMQERIRRSRRSVLNQSNTAV